MLVHPGGADRPTPCRDKARLVNSLWDLTSGSESGSGQDADAAKRLGLPGHQPRSVGIFGRRWRGLLLESLCAQRDDLARDDPADDAPPGQREGAVGLGVFAGDRMSYGDGGRHRWVSVGVPWRSAWSMSTGVVRGCVRQARGQHEVEVQW